jgi:hypothetical protein
MNGRDPDITILAALPPSAALRNLHRRSTPSRLIFRKYFADCAPDQPMGACGVVLSNQR